MGKRPLGFEPAGSGLETSSWPAQTITNGSLIGGYAQDAPAVGPTRRNSELGGKIVAVTIQ